MLASLITGILGALAVFGAGSLESVLARVDRAGAGFRSMSAEIRRVNHTAVINDDSTESGTMVVKRARPGDIRMLLNLTQPDPKTVAVQGHKVELYLPKAATVDEYDIGKYRGLVDQFMLLGFGSSGKDLQGAYKIRLMGLQKLEGEDTSLLELIPKSKDAAQHLSKVELWVSGATGYPVQQKFFFPGGDFWLVTYTKVKINPDLPDSALKLHLPKGVKRQQPQK